MEREVGRGIGMGNTCKPTAVSFQCMTKSTTIKKKKRSRSGAEDSDAKDVIRKLEGNQGDRTRKVRSGEGEVRGDFRAYPSPSA